MNQLVSFFEKQMYDRLDGLIMTSSGCLAPLPVDGRRPLTALVPLRQSDAGGENAREGPFLEGFWRSQPRLEWRCMMTSSCPGIFTAHSLVQTTLAKSTIAKCQMHCVTTGYGKLHLRSVVVWCFSTNSLLCWYAVQPLMGILKSLVGWNNIQLQQSSSSTWNSYQGRGMP